MVTTAAGVRGGMTVPVATGVVRMPGVAAAVASGGVARMARGITGQCVLFGQVLELVL